MTCFSICATFLEYGYAVLVNIVTVTDREQPCLGSSVRTGTGIRVSFTSLCPSILKILHMALMFIPQRIKKKKCLNFFQMFKNI